MTFLFSAQWQLLLSGPRLSKSSCGQVKGSAPKESLVQGAGDFHFEGVLDLSTHPLFGHHNVNIITLLLRRLIRMLTSLVPDLSRRLW